MLVLTRYRLVLTFYIYVLSLLTVKSAAVPLTRVSTITVFIRQLLYMYIVLNSVRYRRYNRK